MTLSFKIINYLHHLSVKPEDILFILFRCYFGSVLCVHHSQSLLKSFMKAEILNDTTTLQIVTLNMTDVQRKDEDDFGSRVEVLNVG